MRIGDYIKLFTALLDRVNKMQNHKFYALVGLAVLALMVAALFALPDILAVWR